MLICWTSLILLPVAYNLLFPIIVPGTMNHRFGGKLDHACHIRNHYGKVSEYRNWNGTTSPLAVVLFFIQVEETNVRGDTDRPDRSHDTTTRWCLKSSCRSWKVTLPVHRLRLGRPIPMV